MEGFESRQVSELTFYKKKSNETIVYYWLVVEVDTLEKVLELQDDWFKTLHCETHVNFTPVTWQGVCLFNEPVGVCP